MEYSVTHKYVSGGCLGCLYKVESRNAEGCLGLKPSPNMDISPDQESACISIAHAMLDVNLCGCSESA